MMHTMEAERPLGGRERLPETILRVYARGSTGQGLGARGELRPWLVWRWRAPGRSPEAFGSGGSTLQCLSATYQTAAGFCLFLFQGGPDNNNNQLWFECLSWRDPWLT